MTYEGLSTEIERNLRTIFKRCVQCPNEVPTCPDCPSGQICSQIPQTCDSCTHMVCIANPSGPPPSSGPNAGAIAGGVVGGLFLMGLALILFWRFHLRKRRQQQELEGWENNAIAQHKALHPGGGFASDAASTRTRASLAASFMSRASNIIQIAYFPGVTNRSASSHNSLAPVPPIPAMYANNPPKSPLANDGDMLFFRPGSTYSATSSRSGNRDTQYTSFSRQSITPSLARSSMVSEVYRDDATVEPMPATTVLRLAPRMVSVKSSPLATPAETPNPADGDRSVRIMMPGQGIMPATSLAGGMPAKATQITVGGKGKGKGRFPVRSPSDDSTLRSGRRTPTVSSPLIETNLVDSEDDDQDEHARARQSLIKPSIDTGSPSSPLRQTIQSPFFDASDLQTPPASTATRPNPYAAMSSTVGTTSPGTSPRRTGQKAFGGLGAVIEEATKKASSVESADKKRDLSPFADEHATE